MKKIFVPFLFLLFVACSKQLPQAQKPVPVSCNFGLTQFNTTARPINYAEETNRKAGRGKPTKPTDTTVVYPPPVLSSDTGVLLIDFDGANVNNIYWGLFYATPANLSYEEQQQIIFAVRLDFSGKKVKITTDEAVYNAAPIAKRTRCIVTENYQWYGQAGGVSFVGSFTWGNDTPCFVFSTLLAYNTKYIAEATSHECGHTLGLQHQSDYDANCNKTGEYHYGSWIMGCSYYTEPAGWRDDGASNCSNNTHESETINAKL